MKADKWHKIDIKTKLLPNLYYDYPYLIIKDFLSSHKIEDYFKLALTTSTKVQVLKYLKDSFYTMHSDDSSMLYKKWGTK